jgi:hypothetical protein
MYFQMTPIELKNVKKGDVFYERGGLHWYKFEALEDCRCKGDIEIQGKLYKQYTVYTRNEFEEEGYLLVTEGLPHYSGKYFKQDGNDRPAV